MKLQPRKAVLGRHVDVGITLVIAQNDIETWLVLLDQVVFENQSLGLGVGDRDLYICDQVHHSRRFDGIMAAMKIARYALSQVTRFANVNDFVLRIEHAIDARPMRQGSQE